MHRDLDVPVAVAFVAYFLLAPTVAALGVVRLAQRRTRANGLAPRDATRRYGRLMAVPWLLYGLNVLAAGSVFTSALHGPLGIVAVAVGLLPILLIGLVARSWAVSLGHPAGRVRVGVVVRGWLVQVAVLVLILTPVIGVFAVWGPVLGSLTAVVLIGIDLATYQDVFRWIWNTAPLPDDEHGRRLRALLATAGVSVRRILVIPASVGAAPNAYVSGVFRPRRYLFVAERLLRDLPPDEVEAVVAHEIGHLQHRHVARLGLAAIVTSVAAALALFGLVSVATRNMGHAIRSPLFGLAAAGTALASLYVTRRLSRRFEFEADDFAARMLGSSKPLADALTSLARENWLAMDDRDAGTFAAHPSIHRRLEHLRNLSGDAGSAAGVS